VKSVAFEEHGTAAAVHAYITRKFSESKTLHRVEFVLALTSKMRVSGIAILLEASSRLSARRPVCIIAFDVNACRSSPQKSDYVNEWQTSFLLLRLATLAGPRRE
jgi:hypothetical protein